MRAAITQSLQQESRYRAALLVFLLGIGAAIIWTATNWSSAPVPVLLTCAALCSLAIVPSRPLWGIVIYIAIVYGFPRYTLAQDFVYPNYLPELIACLTAFGSLISVARAGPEPKRVNTFLCWLMVWFVGWSLLSAGYAIILSEDWTDLRKTFDLKHHPGRLVNAGLLLLVAAHTRLTRRHLTLFALCAGGVLVAKWLIFNDEIRARPGDFGSIVVMLIPLCLIPIMARDQLLARIAGGTLAVLLVALLLEAGNRGAIVALLGAGLAILLQSKRRKQLLLIALPLLLLGTIALQSSGTFQRFEGIVRGDPGATGSIHERLALWRAVPYVVLEHPVLGVGPGRSPQYIAQFTPENINSDYAVHNNFFAVLTELGVPGFALYVALFGGVLLVTWRKGKTSERGWPAPEARALAASIVAYLIVGLFITRHDQALPYILLGFAIALTRYYPRHAAQAS